MGQNGLAINLKHNPSNKEVDTMIKILFFAQLQEEIGASIHYDCSQCTVRDIREYVQQLYPQVTLVAAMAAVNEQYATDEDIVKDGDVVAFLPPVSGG